MTQTIDNKLTELSIQQFATQMKHLAPTLVAQLDALYEGGKNIHFLNGLLGGYTHSYNVAKSMDPGSQQEQYLGAVVAYVAHKIVNHPDFGKAPLDRK